VALWGSPATLSRNALHAKPNPRYARPMTDVRAKTREARLAAALRTNLARRKALSRALGAAEITPESAARASGDGAVDSPDKLG
jgi:hypothetical protein